MACVIVQRDITTTANRAQIIALAAKHRLPAVYPFRFFTNEGGLASYGIEVIDGYKRSATYVDRILRGEKPGELPERRFGPSKFACVVNTCWQPTKNHGANTFPLERPHRSAF
jgi:putative ABC transport system substrate-binding protein